MKDREDNLYKAFIFDLDGVLVDTAKYHFNAWSRLANSLGFDFTEQQNEELKGISRIDSLKKILKWGNQEVNEENELNRLANIKNTWYIEMIEKMTPDEILPSVYDFLVLSQKEGIKIALGSASKNAEIILKRTGITHFFDAIVDGNLVKKSKPDPEVFIKAQQLLKVKTQECVVFEDAQAGIDAAKAVSMKVVGIGLPSNLIGADMVTPDLENWTPDKLIAKI